MRNVLNVPTKNIGADSLELYLFEEQCPPSEHIKSSFRSECPPDTKVKLDNLFEFKRKRGDFLFSVILIFYAFYQKFIGLAVPGTTQLLISISFFSGIILITIGISSLYIARIHEQTRGRPRYIIKEIKNYKES